MKNKVIDYVTPTEACKIIGISPNSTPQITRWINDGKIKGTRQFGNNKAIPVSWVKSECNERGINWEGVELEDDETGVSLDSYIPLKDCIPDEKEYGRLHARLRRGTYEGDYIRFGNAFGLPK